MSPRLVASVAACAAALIAGCGDAGDGPVACTMEARSSVLVQVVDAAGHPPTAATVAYRVEGGPIQAAERVEPPGPCATFAAGRELAGAFDIRAEAPGRQPRETSIAVGRDVCHVITREIVIVLVPL